MTADELISIGTIRTSFGVKGWIKLSSHSGEWDHFADLEELYLEKPGTGRRRRFTVEDFRMHHGGGILKLLGIDSPEEAKSLSRLEILVTKDRAAPLRSDEWYLSDLIGLQVLLGDGLRIGEVCGVIESSDDLLEIKRDAGTTFFVPFRRDFVDEPDLESGRLVLLAPWLAEEL